MTFERWQAQPRNFLNGPAGTGKTFLAKSLAARTPGGILAATTGIAAVNLGEGTTINALLGYFDTASLEEQYISGMLLGRLLRLWRAGLRHIYLDEVSMLDGRQLDIFTQVLDDMAGRGYTLGAAAEVDDDDPQSGDEIGLTLIGDFCQLPPVKAPFAFESPSWSQYAAHRWTLTEVHRTKDPAYIAAVQAVRRGDWATALSFFGPRLVAQTDLHFDGPTILAKNADVDRLNNLRLQQLPGPWLTWNSLRWGKQRSDWKIIPDTLVLKEGALVMVLANARDPESPTEAPRFLYANGDLGYVVGNASSGTAVIRLQRTGEDTTITTVTREVKEPLTPERRKELKAEGREDKIDGKWEIVGAVTYMPLRAAYASTVHKSQGLSLDRVQVNLRDPFFHSPGMLYVALSRARGPEGLRVVGSEQQFRARCTVSPKVKEWL